MTSSISFSSTVAKNTEDLSLMQCWIERMYRNRTNYYKSVLAVVLLLVVRGVGEEASPIIQIHLQQLRNKPYSSL